MLAISIFSKNTHSNYEAIDFIIFNLINFIKLFYQIEEATCMSQK